MNFNYFPFYYFHCLQLVQIVFLAFGHVSGPIQPKNGTENGPNLTAQPNLDCKVFPPGSYRLLLFHKFTGLRPYGSPSSASLFAFDSAGNLRFKVPALREGMQTVIGEQFFGNGLDSDSTDVRSVFSFDPELLERRGREREQLHVYMFPTNKDGDLLLELGQPMLGVLEQSEVVLNTRQLPSSIHFHPIDRRTEVVVDLFNRWFFGPLEKGKDGTESGRMSGGDCFFVEAYLGWMLRELNRVRMRGLIGVGREGEQGKQQEKPVTLDPRDLLLFGHIGAVLRRARDSHQLVPRILMVEDVLGQLRVLCLTIDDLNVRFGMAWPELSHWHEFCPSVGTLREEAIYTAMDRNLMEGRIQFGDTTGLTEVLEELVQQMMDLAQGRTAREEEGDKENDQKKDEAESSNRKGKAPMEEEEGKRKAEEEKRKRRGKEWQKGQRSGKGSGGRPKAGEVAEKLRKMPMLAKMGQKLELAQRTEPRWAERVAELGGEVVEHLLMICWARAKLVGQLTSDRRGEDGERRIRPNDQSDRDQIRANDQNDQDQIRANDQSDRDQIRANDQSDREWIRANDQSDREWIRAGLEGWTSFCPYVIRASIVLNVAAMHRWLSPEDQFRVQDKQLLSSTLAKLAQKMVLAEAEEMRTGERSDERRTMECWRNGMMTQLLAKLGQSIAQLRQQRPRLLAHRLLMVPGAFGHLCQICARLGPLLTRVPDWADRERTKQEWDQLICPHLEAMWRGAVVGTAERWLTGGMGPDEGGILLNIVKKLAMSVHFMANVPGQPDLERHLCRSELKVFVGLGTHMAETLPLTIPEGPNSPLSQPMLARKLAEIPGMQEQIRELCNSWPLFRRRLPADKRRLFVGWNKICKILSAYWKERKGQNGTMAKVVEDLWNWSRRGEDEELIGMDEECWDEEEEEMVGYEEDGRETEMDEEEEEEEAEREKRKREKGGKEAEAQWEEEQKRKREKPEGSAGRQKFIDKPLVIG